MPAIVGTGRAFGSLASYDAVGLDLGQRLANGSSAEVLGSTASGSEVALAT